MRVTRRVQNLKTTDSRTAVVIVRDTDNLLLCNGKRFLSAVILGYLMDL
ncbi:MAG: hypothetical protein QOI89_3408 [Solirubrobacteraceae bacterium]|nr:hypothetical protein [Solirubrobacteraceae bacterium]